MNNNHSILEQMTLVSVAFECNEFLNLNLKTTLRINHSDFIHWIVINNNPEINRMDLPSLDPFFTSINGAANAFDGKVKGSYHHAQALNGALKNISTRFLLILDPDFFIIQPDWIEKVVKYIKERNISFWGAPNHPSFVNKPRYFPFVTCMLIDLEKVGVNELDFTPGLYENLLIRDIPVKDLFYLLMGLPTPYAKQIAHIDRLIIKEIALTVLRNKLFNMNLCKQFPNYISKDINVSRDTGYKIYKRYHRDIHHPHECLSPAFINPLYPEGVKWWNDMLRLPYRLIPESLSRYPTQRSFTVNRFFRDFGLPDINSLGWEEYFWQNSPFGFHVKGASNKKNLFQDFKLAELLGQF